MGMLVQAVVTIEHFHIGAEMITGIRKVQKSIFLHAHINESSSDAAHYFMDTCDIYVTYCSLILFRFYKKLCKLPILDERYSGLLARGVDDYLILHTTVISYAHLHKTDLLCYTIV